METESLVIAIPGLDVVPVIGILWCCPPDQAVPVVSASLEVGLRVIEVTLGSDAPLARLGHSFPEATLGVGTVTRPEQVSPAVEAGARFVVSPIVSAPVVEECLAAGVPVIPGAATPTEIATAMDWGATAVKVFPVAQSGRPRVPEGNPVAVA